MNWVIGIDMYTLMCIKWKTNKNLLYKKINKFQKNAIFIHLISHCMVFILLSQKLTMLTRQRSLPVIIFFPFE